MFWKENTVRFDHWKMDDHLKLTGPNCPAEDFTTCATSGNTSKNISYSKLQQGETHTANSSSPLVAACQVFE